MEIPELIAKLGEALKARYNEAALSDPVLADLYEQCTDAGYELELSLQVRFYRHEHSKPLAEKSTPSTNWLDNLLKLKDPREDA